MTDRSSEYERKNKTNQKKKKQLIDKRVVVAPTLTPHKRSPNLCGNYLY